jgi:hypothetical protein
MRIPLPTPSHEGENIFEGCAPAVLALKLPKSPNWIERVSDAVTSPFRLIGVLEGELAAGKRNPRKELSPPLNKGGLRGIFSILTIALFTLIFSIITTAEDLQIKDTASGEIFYIMVVPGSRALAARSSKAALSSAQLQAAATPSIMALTLDNKTIQENDYVAINPTLRATISPGSGGDIASYNMRIIDALTQIEIVSTTNVLSPTSSIALSPVLASSGSFVGGNSYVAIVSARDSGGLEASLRSPVFRIEVDFKMKGLINGPNPFNPNQEPTYIEYQLTKDADVTIYIYTIAGERIWHKDIVSGSFDGGTAGFNSVLWDGRNHYGETVANGVYIAYVVARNGGEKATGKIKVGVLK